MTALAIVDSSALYAGINKRDRVHARAVESLDRPDLRLVVPALVIIEVAYFAGRRLGADVEARFVRGLADADVALPSGDDWQRIAALVEQYADFPLGTVDASVIALAERLDTDLVITFDYRHFNAVKPKHRDHLTLLP
jgi:predicted nucleic acid-binding protein